MAALRPGTPGATRACPHCRENILESAAVCPACKHHVRFDQNAQAANPDETLSPLTIEGNFRNPSGDAAWEYSVVIAIRNEKGEEIARKLIGVGALKPDELRSFSLSVEMAPHKSKPAPGKPSSTGPRLQPAAPPPLRGNLRR
jgi:hypothetical protein